jgi:hypothetical protein
MAYETIRDPSHTLSPLRQAYHTLKCISEGRTREEIIEEFDDQQLAYLLNWL